MEDTTIEDTLKTVEALYGQKDYAGALRILEGNKSTISSGLWNYNMGTVYAGLGEYSLARYHLLKAEKAGFTSPELVQNLELVESKLDVAKLEKPTSTSDYVIRGAMIASEGILTTLALLILVIGLLNLRKDKSIKALSALVGAVLIILGINWWIQRWPKVIVTKPQMIYEGPSVIFAGKEEVPTGIMLITSSESGWAKVRFPSRFRGWIKKEGLKELQ